MSIGALVPQVRAASILAAAIACHGALGTARATTPLTPELQVNTFTAGQQYHSRMSMSPTGEFVVTWTSSYIDSHAFGIAARRFDAFGAPVGAEFVVNTYTFGDQQYSAVSINEAGEFVVVWRSAYVDGDSSAIVAGRFDENGSAQGAQFVVNTYTTGAQRAPDVAVGPRGGFFVVWESDGQDGSSTGIFARRHDDAGNPMATEFQVNFYTSFAQSKPRIVIAQPSNLVVLWESGGSVVGRRLGQAGAVGAEFLIKNGGTRPALAPTGDGGFVAVWQSADANLSGVQASRFDAADTPLGDELQVNSYTIGTQFDPEVAGNGADFVVVWSSLNQDGEQAGVFARRLDADGLVGPEFQVHQYTNGIQQEPSVGMRSDGVFVVTWDSKQNPISGSYDVFARRYTVLDLVTLDVDGDGETETLTDGRLVIRFLFGLDGPALTDLAVDDDCTRCGADEIVTYLEELGLVLDIDEDGETRPLTDGMLVLRFLSGFDGETLIAGVVDDDCMRCDTTMIEPYLASLV